MQEVKKPPLSVEGQRRLLVCMTDNLARYREVRSLKKEQSRQSMNIALYYGFDCE